MIKTIIEDNAEAKKIADDYGCSESMLADASKRMPEVEGANVGFVICAKRGVVKEDGFEFVFITLFSNFVEGQNGWGAVRWSQIGWEEVADAVDDLIRIEQELLPQAVGTETAKARLDAHRKQKAQ